jgi:hypothetical protein
LLLTAVGRTHVCPPPWLYLMEIQPWPPWSTIDLEQCSFISNRWTCLVLQLSKQDCPQRLECHPYLPVCCPFSIAGYIPAVIVTSMEVSAEAMRRKDHRVVSGEQVMAFNCAGGLCFPLCWSSYWKLHVESKAHSLSHLLHFVLSFHVKCGFGQRFLTLISQEVVPCCYVPPEHAEIGRNFVHWLFILYITQWYFIVWV